MLLITLVTDVASRTMETISYEAGDTFSSIIIYLIPAIVLNALSAGVC